MAMTYEISRVASSRPQKCCRCGKSIPAKEECVKHTRKRRGSINLTEIKYTCSACDRTEKTRRKK